MCELLTHKIYFYCTYRVQQQKETHCDFLSLINMNFTPSLVTTVFCLPTSKCNKIVRFKCNNLVIMIYSQISADDQLTLSLTVRTVYH